MPYDVITFGEAMLRLSPPNFRRLEQARSLDVNTGGAELNTAGVRTSVDLNFRVKLWSGEEAGRCMSDLMQFTDVLVTTEEDVERVFGIKGKDYEEAAARTAERFGLQTVAITLRENPLVWKNA